jgi:hypothetical protein
MKADYRVLLDACVLANFGVCDLLLRLSERPRQGLWGICESDLKYSLNPTILQLSCLTEC